LVKEQLRAIRGMNDILPTTSHRWQKLETTVGKVLAAKGESLTVDQPIVEFV
jgi:histidyl-tRNA synthetase